MYTYGNYVLKCIRETCIIVNRDYNEIGNDVYLMEQQTKYFFDINYVYYSMSLLERSVEDIVERYKNFGDIKLDIQVYDDNESEYIKLEIYVYQERHLGIANAFKYNIGHIDENLLKEEMKNYPELYV